MIAISDTVKKYIIDTYKVTEKNISVIPRGCDPISFNKNSLDEKWQEEWYEQYPQTKNKIVLTLPARISSWKGLDSFLELFSSLDKKIYYGMIVGPTSSSKNKYFRTLQQKVNELGLTDNITFTGARRDYQTFIRSLTLYLIYQLNQSRLAELLLKQLVVDLK